ncbi:DUF6538 domain-containing protein [Cognatishimia sp. MH4019]|uniref:DUF6538 domain-containing protein n=1 Tax=Cognatishimia sp. MH4019 TaxID=2854030 RepID=UPI00351CC2AD
MLKPKGVPHLYRQNDIWHVRVYVPKSVIPLVGKREKHKSMDTTDRRTARERADDWRRDQYRWFNELYDARASQPSVIEELPESMIATMAREVYRDYRTEIDADFADLIDAPLEEQLANEIAEEDRSATLQELLRDFDPISSAKQYADSQLRTHQLALSPDNPSYAKLVRRIREAFIQVYVDIVNTYANTPGRDDNSFFIDATTKEPIDAANSTSSKPAISYDLSEQANLLLAEVSNSRGAKGVAKTRNTMDLMQQWFGKNYDIRNIGRAEVTEFRDALLNVPTNMSKRYPGKTMMEAIDQRKPEHETLSISSVNTHIRNVVQLFNTATMYDGNFRQPNLTRISLKDPVDELDKRYPFSVDQLSIFLSKAVAHASEGSVSPFYWCSIIGLYHGLRANEIAALSPRDFITKHGYPCIDLKLPKEIISGSRKGSSKTIPRTIPIHPILRQGGLLDFVQRSKGQDYLFPDFRETKDGYRSDDISDWATRLITSLGWKGQKLSFHSFRHTFLDALDDAETSEKWKAHLGGWKMKGVMNKNYGSREMKEKIIPAISLITYGDVDQFVADFATRTTDWN